MPVTALDHPAERRDAAALVITLSAAVTAYRAGRPTAIPSVDLVSKVLTKVAAHLGGAGGRQNPVTASPTELELAMLTVLAHVYGTEILTSIMLGNVVRLISHQGGATLLRRVLWGESAAERELAALLAASRVPFEEIALAYSDVLLAEAHRVIAGFRPRAPKGGAGGPRQ